MTFKDTYTTDALKAADPDGEGSKTVITADTYATLEVQERILDKLQRIEGAVTRL